MVAWDRQRLLPKYAERFVDELVVHVRRNHPGREFTRRAPPLPRPKSRPGDPAESAAAGIGRPRRIGETEEDHCHAQEVPDADRA